MTYQFRALAEQAQADGAITADEVLALRRAGWGDGRIDPAEAEAIFVINDHLATRPPEWVDFFVEAIAEYVIAGGSPRGFVSEAQADWLLDRLDRDGRIETMAELELLSRLFDKCQLLPERLRSYALAQIEQIVLTGEGPTRDGGRIDGACITAAECRLLRRFIFSFASDAPGGVSQAEAEMLFRLKDATLGAPNAPEWETLFVQGVANHLMGYTGFRQLSADRAAALDTFMNDHTPRVGGFLGRVAQSAPGEGFARVLGFGRKGATVDRAAEAAVAHRVTEAEDAWLQQWIDSDGQLDPLERALLRFIAAEERRG
ncbi:hypothetical protein ACFOON_10585 [Novosphingobium piscinae]|uniref:Uncharacterized protein n=1 Tax=Novosphingobium piscinae TaxID=1507448 RepID=A0A7X1G0T9_9SPHN|nr:hypothetical protein [Novosphingobium piscinae]MBC2670564.1 hypothetical protein [Novosphingobium piscinae]